MVTQDKDAARRRRWELTAARLFAAVWANTRHDLDMGIDRIRLRPSAPAGDWVC